MASFPGQPDKTSLDLNEARDDGVLGWSGISWTICKQSALCCRQITTPTPHHSIFLQAGCSSQRQTNNVKALKALSFSLSLGPCTKNNQLQLSVWAAKTFDVKRYSTIVEADNYKTVSFVLQTTCHWNSKVAVADINLPPVQLLPFPRVFLANGLNLTPADGCAKLGWSWLADGGSLRLLVPVSWQLPVLPELVDGYIIV